VLNRSKKRSVRKSGLERVNWCLNSCLKLHQTLKLYFATEGKEMSEYVGFADLDVTILTQMKSVFLVHS